MKYIMFEFKVSSTYDERDIENLFELLENRGAIYEHKGGPYYRLYVRKGFEVRPFKHTLLDCSSIEGIGGIMYLTTYPYKEVTQHVAGC